MIQRLTAVTVPRPDIAPLYTCSLPALGKGLELRALGVSVRLRSRLGLGADIHYGWGQVSRVAGLSGAPNRHTHRPRYVTTSVTIILIVIFIDVFI